MPSEKFMKKYFFRKIMEEFKFWVYLVYLSQMLLWGELCYLKLYVHVLTPNS